MNLTIGQSVEVVRMEVSRSGVVAAVKLMLDAAGIEPTPDVLLDHVFALAARWLAANGWPSIETSTDNPKLLFVDVVFVAKRNIARRAEKSVEDVTHEEVVKWVHAHAARELSRALDEIEKGAAS